MKKSFFPLYNDISGNTLGIHRYDFGIGQKMVYIQGGMHGGETTYFIFHRIYNYLSEIESELPFSVTLIPIINPQAWSQRIYYNTVGKFSLINGKDSNQFYDTSTPEKDFQHYLCYTLKSIAQEYKYGFDLHTARVSNPYLYIEADNEYYNEIAKILNFKINLVDFEESGDFSSILARPHKGNKKSNTVKAFTIECGSHDDYDEIKIQEVVNNLKTFINYLIENSGEIILTSKPIKLLKPQNYIVAPVSGFVNLFIKPNDKILKNQELGHIYKSNDLSKAIPIISPDDGIIIQFTKTVCIMEKEELIWYGKIL